MTKEFSTSLIGLSRNGLSGLQAVFALGLLLLSLPTYGQIYTYSDAYESGDSVAAYSSVTGYYNSSTHVYTSNITVYSPTGRTSSASTSGTSISTSISLSFEDGVFSLSSNFVGTCPNPYGGGNHVIGGGGDSLTKVPYIRITDVSANGGASTQDAVNQNSTVILTAQVSASIGGGGAFTLGITGSSISNPAPSITFQENQKPGTVVGGGLPTSVTFGISNGNGGNQTGNQWAIIDAYFISVPSNVEEQNSPKSSPKIYFK